MSGDSVLDDATAPEDAGVAAAMPVSRRSALVTGAGSGLVALAVGAPPAAVDAASTYKYSQLGWRYCPKCRGMCFSPKGKQAGVCVAGGKHRPSLPSNYINYKTDGVNSGSQFVTAFAQCTKCLGMVVSGTLTSACPKGGAHKTSRTALFQIYFGTEYKPMTDDAWTHCTKCTLVYNWAGAACGVCAAGGGHAHSAYSLSFALLY